MSLVDKAAKLSVIIMRNYDNDGKFQQKESKNLNNFMMDVEATQDSKNLKEAIHYFIDNNIWYYLMPAVKMRMLERLFEVGSRELPYLQYYRDAVVMEPRSDTNLIADLEAEIEALNKK